MKHGINVEKATDPQSVPGRQGNLNLAGTAAVGRLLCRRQAIRLNRNRNERCHFSTGPEPWIAPPEKYPVGVQAMATGNIRNRSARFHCLRHYPALERRRIASPLAFASVRQVLCPRHQSGQKRPLSRQDSHDGSDRNKGGFTGRLPFGRLRLVTINPIFGNSSPGWNSILATMRRGFDQLLAR